MRVQAGSQGVLCRSRSPQGGGRPGGSRQTPGATRSLSQPPPPPWLPTHCRVPGSEQALWWAWSPARNVPGTSTSRQASRNVGGRAGCPTPGQSGADWLQPASAPHSPPFPSRRGRASACCRLVPAVRRLIFETKPTRGRKEPNPPRSRYNWHLGSGLAPPRPRSPEAKRPPPQQRSRGREACGFLGGLTVPHLRASPSRSALRAPLRSLFLPGRMGPSTFSHQPLSLFPSSIKNTIRVPIHLGSED